MHSTHSMQAVPELPELTSGVHLLDLDGDDDRTPLYSLVLDHLLTTSADGPALWVDPGRTARATALARLAPTRRLLDRIDVARGFTPHQHHALVEETGRRADGSTPLVVAPRVDSQYRGEECSRGTAERTLSAVAEQLDRITTTRECPVLVTRRRTDDLTAPVEDVATRTIRVVDTELGPQFRADDFETHVYPVDGAGELLQTTLAFWAAVLEHRVEAIADGPDNSTATEVTVSGSY